MDKLYLRMLAYRAYRLGFISRAEMWRIVAATRPWLLDALAAHFYRGGHAAHE